MTTRHRLAELAEQAIRIRDELQDEIIARTDGKTDTEIGRMLGCDRSHANWVKRQLRWRRWVNIEALAKHGMAIAQYEAKQ